MLARNASIFALASSAWLSGCGPSLQRVEQANVYFERCHAADRDPARSDGDRRACWQAWHEHYEVGQPHDRVDYVQERLVMLDPTSGDAIALATPDDTEGGERIEPSVEITSTSVLITPPEPSPESSSTGSSSTGSSSSPQIASSSEIAAPAEGPELSDTLADRPPRVRRRPTPPRSRVGACGTACEPAFVECAAECRVADRGCSDACRHIYRQCSRGCF